MKIERRDIVKCVILSIITCGIYGIIWCIYLARDAVKVKDPNDDGVLEIVLCLLFPPLGFFFAEKKLTEGCQAAGISHNDNSILYLVLAFFGLGIVDYCLLQSALNDIADNYPDGIYPDYTNGNYGNPYGAPQQPYGAPQQPYGNPQQPYGAPQQPYGNPQQPYGNNQPPYGGEQQPPYSGDNQ